MKQLLLVPLVLLFGYTVKAQNILTNSNFANYTTCPNNFSQVDSCVGWFQTTIMSTPDYFHICNGTAFLGVPSNYFGYQTSTSNSYIGLYTIVFESMANPDYKEYLSTSFPPLTVGGTYKVSIVVSLADSSMYATKAPNVLFSVNRPNSRMYLTIRDTPQIDYSSYGILNEKNNWVTLTKTFVADSAYKYLTIGNFSLSSVTDTQVCSYHSVQDSFSYYYIDSVAVERTAPSLVELGTTNQPMLYPNPAKDVATLYLNSPLDDQYEMSIYNIQGALVYQSGPIITHETELNLSSLSSGLYFYQIKNRIGTSYHGKLHKE